MSIKRKLELIIILTVILMAIIYLFSVKQAARIEPAPTPSTVPSSHSLADVIRTRLLTVLTRNTINTYIEGPDGAEGFEYELVRDFANKLGVELDIEIANTFADIIPSISEEQFNIGAANLTATESRKALVSFSQPYLYVTQQLLYKQGAIKPKDITDLIGSHLIVVKDSSHSENLKRIKADHPGLTWTESSEDVQTLSKLIYDGEADFTIADSIDTAVLQRLYPELRVAFDLTGKEPIAWAFSRTDDATLLDAANVFLDEYILYGRMERLKQKYFGKELALDYVSNKELVSDMQSLLPLYKPFFDEAALSFEYNWQLLAAMSYQESHWEKDAVSPTGVEGLMMLTKKAAEDLKIEDRKDPYSSIMGGSRYLRDIQDRLPEDIKGQDRVWLAMAAYNIGIGHIYDARRITESYHADPNSWDDVKKFLPLLAKEEWKNKTKYGLARGDETVQFVGNIQKYYKIISWMSLT